MSALQEVLSEIRKRRRSCRDNNVAPGTAQEDAIYRICEEIVSTALSRPTPEVVAVEIDDGCLTYRSGTVSITVCAETATVYDTAKNIPARKVVLSRNQFFDDASDFFTAPTPEPVVVYAERLKRRRGGSERPA